MNKTINSWIAEFLLRQPGSVALHLLKTLNNIPLSNDDVRLKTTVMLKSIEELLDDASVSEAIIDSLEKIAALFEREKLELSDSIKSAYCSVAVECAVKYLASGGDVGKQKYFDSVKRIWRERIGKLEEKGSELVSEELRMTKEEIEAAISDTNMALRFVERNTRNEALRLVRFYVDEAKGFLGPPFLQSIAKMKLKGKIGGRSDENEELYADDSETESEENVNNEPSKRGKVKEILRSQPPAFVASVERETMERQAANGAARDGGYGRDNANLESGAGYGGQMEGNRIAETDADARPNSTMPDASPRQAMVEGEVSKEVQRRNTHWKESTFGPRHRRGSVRIVDSDGRDMGLPVDSNNEHTDPEASKESLLEERHDKSHEVTIKIVDIEDMEVGTASNKHNNLTTPEVDKVVESRKQSHMELPKTVQDPLFNALKHSYSIPAEMAERNLRPSQRGVQSNHVDNPLLNPSVEAPQNKSDVGPSGRLNAVPKCSLMERNSSAHTMEWSDSIDGSPETSPMAPRNRPRIVTIRREAISPLKRQEEKTLTKRRKINRWTLEEEDALRTGVKQFGKGYWKLILNTFRDVFNNRTEVDLKDKWRNLTKEQ